MKRLYILCCLLLCTNIQQSEQAALTIGIALFNFALKIFGTGLAIVNYMDEEASGPTPEYLDKIKQDLLKEIDAMIEQTQSAIKLDIMLQTHIERLDDIKIAFKSTLYELKYYLKSENESQKAKYKNEFKNQFVSNKVNLHITELSTLLGDAIPELSPSLISLIWEKTNCNMTSIMEFENFYRNLISEAVTLQFAYAKMNGDSIDVVKAGWNESLISIQHDFDTMENECVHRFSASVKDEIMQNISLESLQRNCNERYNWKWNDVYQYEPRDAASHTWSYFVSLKDEDFLFWNGPTTALNRLMVFGDKNTSVPYWNETFIQAHLEANVNRFQRNLHEINDNTAKSLAEVVGAFINALGFIYKGIIVIYEDTNYQITALVDSHSLVAQVAVPAVNDNGLFNIYVYPEIRNNFTWYAKLYNENELSNAADSYVQLGTTVKCVTFMITLLVLS